MKKVEETKYIRDIDPQDVKKYLDNICKGEYTPNPKDKLEFSYNVENRDDNKYRFCVDLYSPSISLVNCRDKKVERKYYLEHGDTEQHFYKKMGILVDLLGRCRKNDIEAVMKEQRNKIKSSMALYNRINKVIGKYKPDTYKKTDEWNSYFEKELPNGQVEVILKKNYEFLLTTPTKIFTLTIVTNTNGKILSVETK